MTEDKKKVLSLGAARPKLELKKPVGGASAASETVRQSFSHGRSKAVVVEAKKPVKRGEAEAVKTVQQPVAKVVAPAAGAVTKSGRATSAVLHNLTKEERETRARALLGAAQEAEHRPTEYFQPELARPEEEVAPVAPVLPVGPVEPVAP